MNGDSWDFLDNRDAVPVDVEQLRITAARLLPGLPLGCRMELKARLGDGPRFSIGMREHATFNAEEWACMIWCYEHGEAASERLDEWLELKRQTRGAWRAFQDKTLDFSVAPPSRSFITSVGDVVDAFGALITAVMVEQ